RSRRSDAVNVRGHLGFVILQCIVNCGAVKNIAARRIDAQRNSVDVTELGETVQKAFGANRLFIPERFADLIINNDLGAVIVLGLLPRELLAHNRLRKVSSASSGYR